MELQDDGLGAAAGCGGCGAVCFEPEDIQTKERWVYKGAGMGSYAQVGNMEMVGAGPLGFDLDLSMTSCSG